MQRAASLLKPPGFKRKVFMLTQRLESGVAQVFNLLYRRLSVCAAEQPNEALSFSNGGRLESRRYSRLKVCVTGSPIFGTSRGARPAFPEVATFYGRVAQVFNLLYRRLSVCAAERPNEALDFSNACRLESRRYSRLKVCVTEKTRRCSIANPRGGGRAAL